MRITLDAVTKRFEKVKAVDAVSLGIEQGECFFLLGPSGCGKTTILRMLAGFVEQDSGSILFNDRVVDGLPPHKRNTGMVFQQYALWPHMTVFKNVEFGLRAPGRDFRSREMRERVTHILDVVRMGELADRKPNQLSGGQQQRVALARALVVEPDCLLLDEPLSNLDARLRAEMRVEIRRIIKGMGITTVYVTHDQAEALSMADRCAILRDGRVEQLGAPREIYEHPRSRFVADFVGGSNLLPGVLSAISGAEARIESAAGVWLSKAPNTGLKTGSHVVLSVRPEKLHVLARDEARPNLFRGRLLHTMYYGDVVEHLITFQGGAEARSVEPSATAAACLPGTDVRCWAAPEDVLILPDA